MLRVRQRSDQARLLDDRDRAAALEVCAADPVANVFVESRIRAFGLDPGRLGAQMWGLAQGGRLVSHCYGGANLVPAQATPPAVAAFADRAVRQGRRCSSIVGASAAVSELWGILRPYWGPGRQGSRGTRLSWAHWAWAGKDNRDSSDSSDMAECKDSADSVGSRAG